MDTMSRHRLAYRVLENAAGHMTQLWRARPMWKIYRESHTPTRARAIAPLSCLRRAIADDRGTVTIELVLVTPIILFLILLLVQVMLLMTANHFVSYAAYAAARAAVVGVPADATADGGLGPNRLVTDEADPKFATIRRAAVHALWPISGRLASSGMVPNRMSTSLQRYYDTFDRPTPNWVDQLADDKLRYAEANTRLTFMHAEMLHPRSGRFAAIDGGRTLEIGTKGPITTRVEHDFGLTVPIVAGLFADGRLGDDRGGRYYTRIAARCTLNNEGILVTMPQAPSLPRVP